MRYLKWRFLIFGILSICIVFFSILYLCHFLFPIPQEWLKVQGNSPQIFAENGEALMQFLNKEEQWQFDIPLQKISPFFLQALVSTEDKNFYSHNGIDFIAIFRAIIGNITRTRTYSGASTISTQCIRLLTDRSRNILTKIYEAFRAWQLEKIWTKDQILEFYCNHTPYGGNIVGVQAASWRYFDKDASQLSLSEASLLAGLPQSPNRY
ncbi:MAG TPA: biosynthetic peptidoglycan transglycosylase, partial [Planctomycetota bacterium]|nr:biosynthetic peptidoglycan transglycosylase [Planctomycetota bacterium]